MNDRLMLLGSFLEVLIVSIVVSLIFLRLDDSANAILSRKSVLYLSVSLQPSLQILIIIYKLCEDLKLFDRERQDSMYSVGSFLVSWFVANLPLQIILCTLFSTISYAMINLRGDSVSDALYHFGIYLAVMQMEQLVTISLAFFFVSISREYGIASFLNNVLFCFYSQTTGFFLPLTILPVWVSWFQHISYLSFSYRILMTNEFQDRVFACPDSPLGPNNTDPSCIGNNILTGSGLKTDDVFIPFISLVVSFIIYLGVATALLVLKRPGSDAAIKSIKVKKSMQRKPSRKISKLIWNNNSDSGGNPIPNIEVKLDNVRVSLMPVSSLLQQTTQAFLKGSHKSHL